MAKFSAEEVRAIAELCGTYDLEDNYKENKEMLLAFALTLDAIKAAHSFDGYMERDWEGAYGELVNKIFVAAGLEN